MSSTEGAAPPDGQVPGVVEYLLLAGISLAWGTSYMFTKVAVAEVQPVTLVMFRLILAATVMLVYVRARRIAWPHLAEMRLFVLVGLLSNAAPLCLIAVSVSHVNSSVTAITMSLVPLITVWLGVFAGTRPDLRNVIGIALGLVGVFILFGPDAFATFGSGTKGLMAAVAAALVFSVSLFVSRRVRHIDPAMVTAMSLTMAMGWSIVFALVLDGPPRAVPQAAVIGAILVLALWNTAAASLMMFALLGRATPAFTSYNNQLVPGVAVLCGTLFLGEPLTIASIFGVLMVLIGVAVSTVRTRRIIAPA
jgi:drug/metabolite transporter (DMT)-like permease